MNNNPFLPHLYEPLRRQIAVKYAQQESRKLFPSLLNASAWKSIDKSIISWYNPNDKFSIRTLYNGIHGISMGFRLKSLVPWLTSLNIAWKETEVPLAELWFGGQFGPIKFLKVSERAADVQKNIFKSQNKIILKKTQDIILSENQKTAPRDNFPVFAVLKLHYGSSQKTLRVIDGNRRLVKAILNKKKTILTAVGEPLSDPVLCEHWVPTQILVDLVFWYEEQIKAGRDTTSETAKIIAELIRHTSAGRTEFAERSIHKEEKTHKVLLTAVIKLLSKDNITL